MINASCMGNYQQNAKRKRRLPNVQKREIPASTIYYLAARSQTGADPW